ncbi:MAG: hypothetical protein DHS20C18_20430 [Saprospiraceae bacterium]|nr:MAG: hypothetical protein DHS20C18_20430 [Saprospiraceae bacterium]
MKPSKWEQVSELYFTLVALEGQARDEAIAEAYRHHPDLMSEVEQMFQEEEALHPALRTNGPWFGNPADQDRDLIGTQLGPYRLVDYLGGGGMGSVFLAERIDGEFERQVALKLIRTSYQKPEALERFRQERQILAGLQHPNIARLYEGGRSVDGRLYFTMEQVEGETLVAYIQKKQLSQNERLDLFEKASQAIAYAHRQLVLHLDIKPGNILVETNGQVKVVDFGVSKWVEDASEVPASASSMPYTLAFAAPEQIGHGNLSTATDIYALGILLYKLLTDQLPFDRTTLSTIRSGSERAVLATSDATLFNFTTSDLLKGDFYHICAKCLQTNPTERYGSVEQLLNDLQAVRQNYPISFRRNQPIYVARKFLQRNRAVILTLTSVLLLLLATATYYTLQLRKERNQAQKEAAKSKQLVGLLTDMFKSADPFLSQKDTLPVRYFLDSLSNNLPNRLRDEPELLADMSVLLSSVYNALGGYPRADSLAQRAVSIYQKDENTPLLSLANAYHAFADVQYSLGDYKGADSIFTLALQFFQRAAAPPNDRANCYLSLGHASIELGHYARADSLYKLAFDDYQRVFQSPNLDLAATLQGRGDAMRKQKHFQESETFYQEALKMKQALFTPPNTEIAYTLNHLASLYYDQFQYEKGIPFALNSYEQRLAIFGLIHVETIASLSNLSRLYNGAGRYREALEIRQKLVPAIRQIFGDHLHPYVLGQEQGVAILLGRVGRWQESADAFRQILDKIPELRGAYPTLYVPYHGYGIALYYLGELTKAETYLREAFEKMTTSIRIMPGDQVKVPYDLAVCLYDSGKLAEAKNIMEEAKSHLADYPGLPAERIAKMEKILSAE